MYRQIVPSVLDSYGVTYKSIGNVQKGYRNESYPILLSKGTTVNLLFYKRESDTVSRFKRADSVSQFLADGGLPVRTRYDNRTLRLSNGTEPSYAALYTYLPGKTIPWEAYTKKHIKLLGYAMSDMHAVLSDMPINWSVHDGIAAQMTLLIHRMELYFTDESIRRAATTKLGVVIESTYFDRLRTVVAVVASSPDSHPLHMDMVRGNVLFSQAYQYNHWQIDDVAISGVIDFEKTAYGHPLFDIARTLAFLLVDCRSKDEAHIRRYFLTSGYQKRGRATYDHRATICGIPHAKLLDGLISLYLLHDLYKFLRHTPYESLDDNEHYIRTRNILIRHGMVRYL